MPHTLIVVTRSFPYTTEEHSFLINEVNHYRKKFDRVVVIPQATEGDPVELPSNIVVDTGYARQRPLGYRGRVRAAAHPLLYGELFTRPAVGPSAYRSAVGILAGALSFARYIEPLLRAEFEAAESVLIYTYWFDYRTLGALLLKERFPGLVVITRAHGTDLYEEDVPERSPQYFRRYALSAIDRVFCVSDHGQAYLRNRYPERADKIAVAKLGTRNPRCLAAKSNDSSFHIVSCSGVIPIKRVPLIAETVGLLAVNKVGIRVEWTHIGAGSDMDEAERVAKRTFPSGDRFRFLGEQDHAQVMNYLGSVPIDAFINLSVSEGVPVAIMEAQSFGIPVIATAVGGSPSLVNNENGLLVDPAWSAAKIANAMGLAIDLIPRWHERRSRSRESWERNSDEQSVFSSFVDALASISPSGRSPTACPPATAR
jgi:glycosyltransferase involved in cell wall biosynthesis